MEAIRALQQQLMEAQRASNARKISERNCIDLVQKLIQTQQVKLFHTANGKEYLTPEQLDNEIKDCLEACGGRISVTELPNEMGIGMEILETRVEALRKRDSSLHKLNNDLFSQQYLQMLAQEVEESLEESGSLAVADLASRYNLPSEYIRNSVLVLLTSQAVVRHNTVHTSSYAARFEARVRGCLRACLQPVILSQLATRHGFDPDMLSSTVQKLIREEVLLGKLQGGAFTPKAYTEVEASKTDSFFESNGFLTAAMAKSCNLTLKDWVTQRKAEGFTLLTAFLAPHLANEVQAAATEALASGSWIDVQPLLPPALAVADASELLLQLSSELPVGHVLLEHVAVSAGFVEGVAKALEGEVQQAAEKSLKPKAKEEDDGSKKRKAKGAKSQKKRGEEEDDGAGPRTSESGISNEAILNHLADEHPDLPEHILEDLCQEVQKRLSSMVTELAERLRSTLQTKQKQQFEQADKLVQERYEKLVLGLRALENANEKQDSPLYQHLLRDVVMEPLHALIALRLEEATGQSVEVTSANRKQSLEKLATAEKKPPESLQRLLAAFGKKDSKETKDAKDGKDAKEGKEGKEKGKLKKGESAKDADDALDLSELYHAAADDSHIYCRKVDKKREKAAAQEQQKALKERLKETTPSDAMVVCHVGLQLALSAEGVSGLVLPCELWALRLACGFLKEEEIREVALHLCDLCEDKEGDAVEREAAVAQWRNRFL